MVRLQFLITVRMMKKARNGKMEKEEWEKMMRETIDKLLRYGVETEPKCQSCAFRHGKDICFFAFDCLMNKEKYYRPQE